MLGFVSLLMDLSSEAIHSLLPVFLVSVLGASALSLGIIEGLAEAAAAFTRVFSGALSDWLGRRKPLVLLGYGLAALSKPLFPLATGVGTVLTARVLDRVGKGIRGAPRDALLADLAPPGRRGAAYGLRQSMDTTGAFLGPALALVLMALFAGDIRLVLWVAVVPAVICVALIVFGLQEPEAPPRPAQRRLPLSRRELARLPRRFWLVVAFTVVLTLARFSEAFLLLRGSDTGLPIGQVPLVLIVMNAVYALSAFPLGRLADRHGRRRFILAGALILVCADLLLAVARDPGWVFAGAAVWGLHMGATQGLLSAVTADAAPADLRGTAFGVLEPHGRCRPAGRQRAGRVAVGRGRPRGHLPGRRRAGAGGRRRTAAGGRRTANSASPVIGCAVTCARSIGRSRSPDLVGADDRTRDGQRAGRCAGVFPRTDLHQPGVGVVIQPLLQLDLRVRLGGEKAQPQPVPGHALQFGFGDIEELISPAS